MRKSWYAVQKKLLIWELNSLHTGRTVEKLLMPLNQTLC